MQTNDPRAGSVRPRAGTNYTYNTFGYVKNIYQIIFFTINRKGSCFCELVLFLQTPIIPQLQTKLHSQLHEIIFEFPETFARINLHRNRNIYTIPYRSVFIL